MLLIPALDLKGGKCVRLRQGRMDETTVFSDDPVAMAGQWVRAGARRLHIVDLDGAMAGRPVNGGIIREIARAFPDVSFQVGGGIRDEATVESYLGLGVDFVIIGTAAVREPDFVAAMAAGLPGRIIVGLDARDGRVAIEGWAELSSHEATDLARRFEQGGVSEIIYTDIRRDGMLTGVNIEATVALARAVSVPIIASGGIADMDDIRALCDVAEDGVAGAILGRSIYEGTLDFAEALEYVDGRS